ncbi:MAG TPA: hypothetical protein VMF30_17870, partial [Pirellulales bacterium]|nr:hypothetical protein [Pirellulales bacterium]
MIFRIGPLELLLLVFVAGSARPPLGIPAIEGTAIERAAPDECLGYFSSAGMAKPDPASTNHTEQVLADEDVQTFF